VIVVLLFGTKKLGSTICFSCCHPGPGRTFKTMAGLPVVATNDVRFIDSSDFDAHEIRTFSCRRHQKKDRARFPEPE
ncbi:hypothetical protein O5264_29815, partial [Escherichia coli]|nr:hypothetical protein [Escherichia coli]